MMLVVVGFALVAAILRIDEGRLLAGMLCITAGPIFGAVVQRWWGGRGILGSVFGGVVSYVGFGIVMYLRAYLSPAGIPTQYVGPVDSFPILTVSGTIVGAAVGILIRRSMLVLRVFTNW
jgi:hypothetical protein